MNASITKNKNQNFDQDKAFPHILMSPTIIVMLLLTVYPLLFTVYYSFTDYNLLKSRTKGVNFIAFDNYTNGIISEEEYQMQMLELGHSESAVRADCGQVYKEMAQYVKEAYAKE